MLMGVRRFTVGGQTGLALPRPGHRLVRLPSKPNDALDVASREADVGEHPVVHSLKLLDVSTIAPPSYDSDCEGRGKAPECREESAARLLPRLCICKPMDFVQGLCGVHLHVVFLQY
jgi:hypothetical protein